MKLSLRTNSTHPLASTLPYQVVEWAERICIENKLDSAALAKAFTSLLMSLGQRTEAALNTVRCSPLLTTTRYCRPLARLVLSLLIRFVWFFDIGPGLQIQVLMCTFRRAISPRVFMPCWAMLLRRTRSASQSACSLPHQML